MTRAGRGTTSVVRSLLLVAAVLAPIAGGRTGVARAEQDPELIVLVTLDTLRWDSFRGDGRASSMPLLLARSQNGLLLDRFYAATSKTQPSHASMLTGLHPWEHRVTNNGMVLDTGFDTVAELLSQAGFETAAVVSSYPLSRRFGFDQGFDHFVDDFQVGNVPQWEGMAVEGSHFFTLGEAITDIALAVLDGMTKPRRLLWVHYFDPHTPYGYSSKVDSPRGHEIPGLEKQGIPLGEILARARVGYEADVRYLDRALARLIRQIEERSKNGRTHFIVVSDHGESFGEGGRKFHGKHISDEQIHVPLLILSPNARAGTQSAPAGSVDVASTILALAGTSSAARHGRDLLAPPHGTSEAAGMRCTSRRRPGAGQPNLFFLVDDGGGVFRGGAVGLDEGPGDLQSSRAKAVAERMLDFDAQLRGLGTTGPIDPEVQRRLEALGYAD
jgi:arylsulfatase